MSCRNAPSSSRSGRSTSRVCRLASYAVCTRCRSSVNRCTGLCWGRLRIRVHSGSQRSISPYRSQVSQAGTRPGPAPSRVISAARAAGGHGAGSGGQYAASHSQVARAMGSRVVAAAAATRSDRLGSGRAPMAVRASTSSPSCSTTSRATGRRSGRPGAARCRPERSRSAARQASSRAWLTVRASPATSRRSASPSSAPSSRATPSRSCATRRSTRRPTCWCSASRVSSSRRCAAYTAGRSASVTPAVAMARRMPTSRSPPAASLRSPSSRNASSPCASHRAAVISRRPGSWRIAVRRQWSVAVRASWSVRAGSPATCRASSRPRATLTSSWATDSASATVRTEWSSRSPASQIGYQSDAASSSMPGTPACSSTRSRSP